MAETGTAAMDSVVFRKLETRLASFSPPIKLRDHVVENPQSKADLLVHPLITQGMDFTLRDPDLFVSQIRNARTSNEKAFAEGSTRPIDWKQHWAMTTSLLATKGIGFREPWRYYLNDRASRIEDSRPKLLNAPQLDLDFAGNFGEANPLDLSALHISVAYGKWTACNIHVDETGIALANMDSSITITPNVVSHLVNELVFKAIIGEHLPTWVIDRFNIRVLSPELGYKRVGISYDVLKGESYKLTLSASCGLDSCQNIDISKVMKLDRNALKQLNPTINFTKTFSFGGG